MKDEVFYLLMKDHWTAEDFAEYDKLTKKPIQTPIKKEKPVYEIGDIMIAEDGWTYKKIDENTWEVLY